MNASKYNRNKSHRSNRALNEIRSLTNSKMSRGGPGALGRSNVSIRNSKFDKGYGLSSKLSSMSKK